MQSGLTQVNLTAAINLERRLARIHPDSLIRERLLATLS